MGHAKPKHGVGMVARPNRLALARYLVICFLTIHALEVHKELLVRCPKTIRQICMSILVLNKTIIFVWLTKII